MHVNIAFPDRSLKGAQLVAPILIIVTAVRIEKMRAGADKPEERNWVLRFNNVDGKTGELTPLPFLENVPGLGHGLVLNRVKALSIAKALNEMEMDNWVGQRVVLYAEKKTKGGEEQHPIRARAPKASAPSAAAGDTGGGK